VGFRPTVWRLATELKLTGNVCNDGQGVLIQLNGKTHQIDQFLQQLATQSPPLAQIEQIQSKPLTTVLAAGFEILASQQNSVQTGVVADAATCTDCLHELHDPNDRRFRYPFLNCTHCGPRFSLIKAIPYDRQQTSMAVFQLCELCQQEYDDPQDRRFHAQPTACPNCGPQLWLSDHQGQRLAQRNSALQMAARQIQAGKIVAIKGIGGVHLACDASNEHAVQRLRARKQRPSKPLAMMAKDLQQIKQHCHLHEDEIKALQSSAAPILILAQRTDSTLPNNLAPQQKQWGFMLPHSPLHSLLLNELEQPIVLTSGNRSGEPQCIDNQQVLETLNDIADLFLLHDCEIVNRLDDSVLRLFAGQLRVLRRGRGYAPERLALPEGFERAAPLLALGGELKNTFCLLHNGSATLSQHIGDLEQPNCYDDYQHHLRLYQQLFAQTPEHLVIDRHPEYLSSKLGRQWADEQQLKLSEVQHHHAHLAACMGENGLHRDHPAILGIVFDGLGFGTDDQLWGGEFLLTDYRQIKRLAHLQAVALPGGAMAMREPWRNTFAQLQRLGWLELQQQYPDLPLLNELQQHPIATLEQMIQRAINAPHASSMGRLFDAVADLQQQINPALMATRFHLGVINSTVEVALALAKKHDLQHVALSGGVFQNKTLLEGVIKGLQQQELQVYSHQQLPANDGGLAFGQALIGAAQQTTWSN